MSDVTNEPVADKPIVPDAAKGNDPVKTEEPKYTQADIDRVVKERLEREKANSAKVAEAARKEAEEKALAENAQWKELAEKREKDLATLTPLQEEVERYKASLTKRWEAEKKDVPDYILPLLEEMPLDKRLDYITENREKFTQAVPAGKGRVEPTPQGSTGRTITTEEREKAKQQDRRQFGGFFH